MNVCQIILFFDHTSTRNQQKRTKYRPVGTPRWTNVDKEVKVWFILRYSLYEYPHK